MQSISHDEEPGAVKEVLRWLLDWRENLQHHLQVPGRALISLARA
jgi:hypothetical protein